jgi:hypothetical protein
VPLKGNIDVCNWSKPVNTLPDTRENFINSSDKTTDSMRLLPILQRYHRFANAADMNKFATIVTRTVTAA